jgi:hypothetical protein
LIGKPTGDQAAFPVALDFEFAGLVFDDLPGL